MENIALNLNSSQYQLVVSGLLELPAKKVMGTLQSIENQVQAQLNEKAKEQQKKDKKPKAKKPKK